MKKILLTTYAAALTILMSCGMSVESQLKVAAEAVNKTCPMTVDSETRLDNAAALPDQTLQYNYTLVNIKKTDIDTSIFTKTVIPTIRENIRTNPDMKTLRDLEVNMAYSYKDKDGDFIYKFVLGPKDYK